MDSNEKYDMLMMFPSDKPGFFLVGSMVTWCNVDRTTFLLCSSSTAMPQQKHWNTQNKTTTKLYNVRIYIYAIYIYIYISLFCFYHLSSHVRHFRPFFSILSFGENLRRFCFASSWISWVKETTPISLAAPHCGYVSSRGNWGKTSWHVHCM